MFFGVGVSCCILYSILMFFGVGVSCCILYSIISYLRAYVSCSGSITSVGEERVKLSAIVYL